MMITIYQGERCGVGTPVYAATRQQAERIAQMQRSVGKPATVAWQDDYNDYSARGRFVVTSRT